MCDYLHSSFRTGSPCKHSLNWFCWKKQVSILYFILSFFFSFFVLSCFVFVLPLSSGRCCLNFHRKVRNKPTISKSFYSDPKKGFVDHIGRYAFDYRSCMLGFWSGRFVISWLELVQKSKSSYPVIEQWIEQWLGTKMVFISIDWFIHQEGSWLIERVVNTESVRHREKTTAGIMAQKEMASMEDENREWKRIGKYFQWCAHSREECLASGNWVLTATLDWRFA